MLAIQRHKAIEKILIDNGSVMITDLAQQFEVSEETIRRDLEKLEKSNILRRVRGGAYLLSDMDKEVPINIRKNLYQQEKQLMADKCLDFIEDGDTIMLDSSTTVSHVAGNINKYKKKVTIITNSLKIVDDFKNSKLVKVIVLGGTLRKRMGSFVGRYAISQLSTLYANKAILSCTAINKDFGITDDNEEESSIRQLMVKNSQEVILLADNTKFDDLESYKICGFKDIHTLITEQILNKNWEELLKENGVKIRYTQPKSIK